MCLHWGHWGPQTVVVRETKKILFLRGRKRDQFSSANEAAIVDLIIRMAVRCFTEGMKRFVCELL